MALGWAVVACTQARSRAGPRPPPVSAPAGSQPAAAQPGTQAAAQVGAPAGPQPASPPGAQSTVSSGVQAAAPAAGQTGSLEAWNRNHEGLEPTASVQECLGCHEGTSLRAHTSHPVDADYATVAGRPDASLRPPDEAQRRGARLPGGRLHCLSCHDPRSPWRSHVALPAGARVRAALHGAMADEDAKPAAPAPAPASGEAVNTMPLCQACHTYGD